MDQLELVKYLATGEAPAKPVIAVSVTSTLDPVDSIVSHLMAVGMLAKDLHYRARGKAFYAIHLLADLVWEVRRSVDELLEVYYLGEKESVPPLMANYETFACNIVHKLLGEVNVTADFSGDYTEDELCQAVSRACRDIVDLVEIAKQKPLRSGTGAVLDEISKKSLQNAGLLARTEARKEDDNPAPSLVSAT